MVSVYEFTCESAEGPYTLWDDHGKVLLLVHLGLDTTRTPHMDGVDRLAQMFAPQGLQVIGLPHPQPTGVAPPTRESLGVSFPVMMPIDGASEPSLLSWLNEAAPGAFGTTAVAGYTKFLVGRDGTVRGRFAATHPAADLIKAVRVALAEPVPPPPVRPAPPASASASEPTAPAAPASEVPGATSESSLEAVAAADAVGRELARSDESDDLLTIAADLEALSQETAMTEQYYTEQRRKRIDEQLADEIRERMDPPPSAPA